MKPFYSSLLFIALLFACNTSKKITFSQELQPSNIAGNGKLFASVFMQQAAEYHALCLQSYNIARLRLDNLLAANSSSAQHPVEKPKAIVTDLDETVLDNSINEVHQDLQGKGFDPVEWKEWTSKAEADTVPGSFTFFKYAASKGIEIFYISNRDENDRTGTLQNLQRFDFPNADNAHLLLRQNTSGKEPRRQQVLAEHDIVLLFGDNLSDFSDMFDKKTAEERMLAAQQLAAQFGNRYIVLPNPIYGDWESSLYQYKQLTTTQKDSAIKSRLKSKYW
jgi:5'-nucleotidase (lipoprotein e(P4) family)